MSVTGKDLIARGWPEGKVIGLALDAALNQAAHSHEHRLEIMESVLANPQMYINSRTWGETARELIALRAPAPVTNPMLDHPRPYRVWGGNIIEEGAYEQMKTAMRLPISVAGALMPDAHQGYGLPVGGVLATDDTVIPYAVGVDIACRMRLSVLPVSSHMTHMTGQQRSRLAEVLVKSTNFGAGGKFKPARRPEHEVLDDPAWEATPFLKGLKDVAAAQLGTSGSGNHFVEWGIFEFTPDYERPREWGGTKKYLAILSHSGSRGVGFKICNKYAKIARKKHPELPKEAQELAWLGMQEEEGVEYWLSMELAGRFAKANHEVIHEKMTKALGHEPILVIDHHHNYAWRETHRNQEMIVHRKGATPAAAGELGVIPGDSVRQGYIVEGKGVEESLDSASHGAGRLMSRTKAHNNLDREEWQDLLRQHDIYMIGGGLDEAPYAYKDISEVVSLQDDLVNVVGTFTPKIVRMDAGKAGGRYRKE